MRCRDFAEIVIDLARDQEMDNAARAHAISHAELCIHCAARLAEERAWMANVRVVRTELMQRQASPRVEAALLTALRSQRHHKTKPLPIQAQWLSWRLASVVAPMLLIALAGFAWMSFHRKPQSQQASLPTASPTLSSSTPAPESMPEKELVAATSKPVRPLTARVLPRRPNRLPAIKPSEPVAPFYSLVEEGQMAPLESVRIVRIEVPASSLVKLGVPLTEKTLSQPVQADLLLGQDGLARAIRFVPSDQNARTQ
ncbi:MAG TPA: hypothetical protein VFZ34_13720 [Blastocatellia bacterium]|nr:hypothetical protein [Blastocatellia bacterium]